MDEQDEVETEDMFPTPVGDRLKAAREAKGISLDDIARDTRIPSRHLVAIDESRYDKLPAPTYALGFVKAYARYVGEDEVEVGQALRNELSDLFAARQTHALNEPTDPARIPSKAFAWVAIMIGVLGLGAYLIWRFTFNVSDADRNLAAGIDTEVSAPAENGTAPANGAAPAAALPTAGQVVLTATDNVWIGVKDANRTTLISKELKAGESFAVPANASGAVLTTARPQALKVTIAGREIPPLGAPDTTVKVPLDASSLATRGTGQPANGTAPPGNGT